MVTRSKYRKIISDCSKEFRVNELIIESIIMIESGDNTWATRYEPGWRWFLNPIQYAKMRFTSTDTERVHQATSWGLMQVMGTVASELGFALSYPELCKPQVGIHYGVKKFAKCMEKHGNALDALSAYNSGKPASKSKAGRRYADKVLKHMDALLSLES